MPQNTIETHGGEWRLNCSEWKPYYLWFPRRFGGRWHWRVVMFRRYANNLYHTWTEYCFLPLPGLPIYGRYHHTNTKPRWRDLV
jgi:hypothetical protein